MVCELYLSEAVIKNATTILISGLHLAHRPWLVNHLFILATVLKVWSRNPWGYDTLKGLQSQNFYYKMLRYYLTFSFLYSHMYTVKFSRGYMTYGIETDQM